MTFYCEQCGYLHRLGEFRGFVVDVCHPHAHRGGARVRLVPAVHCHDNKFVQMVGPLVVEPPGGENGSVW